tara:strand:+ start:20476 stop:21066 length:591 start_codon:yes stop_codon:yes gene_type:complete
MSLKETDKAFENKIRLLKELNEGNPDFNFNKYSLDLFVQQNIGEEGAGTLGAFFLEEENLSKMKQEDFSTSLQKTVDRIQEYFEDRKKRNHYIDVLPKASIFGVAAGAGLGAAITGAFSIPIAAAGVTLAASLLKKEKLKEDRGIKSVLGLMKNKTTIADLIRENELKDAANVSKSLMKKVSEYEKKKIKKSQKNN